MGHVSVRNPTNSSTFFIPLQMGPAVVSSASDIGEYLVEDGSPIDSNALNGPGFAERYIHSEILKRYPDVNSVVHSHNEDVLPFTVMGGEGVGVESVYHMAGFLGAYIIPSFGPNCNHEKILITFEFKATMSRSST